MAANKKTLYVILYWFSFKIILCMFTLWQRETVRKQQDFLNAEEKSIGYVIRRWRANQFDKKARRLSKMIKASIAIAESVVHVWDRSMQLKIVLQKSQTFENVVRKGTGSGRAVVKNIHWVISGEIVPNDLFLGEMSIENVESHPWEAMLRINGRDFTFKLDSGVDVTQPSFSAFSLPPYYFRVEFWQGLQVDRFDGREARRPSTIRKFALLGTVFVLPETVYSKYLHQCFCKTFEVHLLASPSKG